MTSIRCASPRLVFCLLATVLAVSAATGGFAAVRTTPVPVGPSPASSPPGSAPANPPVASTVGLVLVSVDTAACATAAAPCEGLPPVPAAATNANPVRVVVQGATPRPLDGLTRDDFAVASQFSPPDAAPLRLLDCDSCFETAPGGTYSMWVAPLSDNWRAGTYFLRIGLAGDPGVLPALARIDIPLVFSPPQGQPPRAILSAIPPAEQTTGHIAIFDGSASYDPDGQITFWRWTILSDLPGGPAPEVVQGPSVRALERSYDVEQGLVVQLDVTDDPAAPALAAAGLPVPWDDTRAIPYRISCYNPPPVADAGPDQTANAAPGQLVNIVLNGTGTTDDRPIGVTADHYRWDCGNGTVPTPVFPGDFRMVVCRYIAYSGTPNTWTATLTVFDNGSTGELENGVYPCQRSASDTATVRLVVP